MLWRCDGATRTTSRWPGGNSAHHIIAELAPKWRRHAFSVPFAERSAADGEQAKREWSLRPEAAPVGCELLGVLGTELLLDMLNLKLKELEGCAKSNYRDTSTGYRTGLFLIPRMIVPDTPTERS